MLTKKGLELEILSNYDSNICASFSINAIANLLNKKYPYINKKVTDLIDEEILLKSEVGKSYQCSLNLSNQKTIILLTLNEIEKRKAATKNPQTRKILDEIIQLKKKVTIHTALISAKRLHLVLEDKNLKAKVLAQINHDATIHDKESFKDELLKGRIIKERVILYGFERYYELVEEIRGELMLRHSPLIRHE